MHSNNSSAKSILSSAGIKSTSLRIKLISIVMAFSGPFSADDVIDVLADSGVHFVTIYRNLKLFKDKGILREVDMRRDSMFYEFNGDDHHHHIVCTDCGYIEKFYICESDSLSRQVLEQSEKFNKITDHSFEMFGTCDRCSSK